MENSAKALEIAGGILIAVLVVSVLLLVYNNMKSFPNTQEQVLEAEQLKEFNQSFLSYNTQSLQGIDMISLINKAVDNRINKEYDVEITFKVTKDIKIEVIEHYLNKYGKWAEGNIIKNLSPLEKGTYELKDVYDFNLKEFKGYIKELKDCSNTQNTDIYCDKNGDETKGEEIYLKRYENSIEGSYPDANSTGSFFTKNNAFTEFKTKKFKCTGVEYNNYGRVTKMTFEEI